MRSAILAVLTATLLATGGAGAAQSPMPPAPVLEHVFDLTVRLGKAVPIGDTAIGARAIVPVLGGTVAGPDIRGVILPGGWDWQLIRRDGCVQIRADYMLRTDDGMTINILDTGVNCLPAGGKTPPRTQPVFEAPRGRYDWLGRSAFIGAAVPFTDGRGSGLKIVVYRVR